MKKILCTSAAILMMGSAFATDRAYEVTITNITSNQIFTPILAATHSTNINYFELGNPASIELATLAESGNPAPLDEVLLSRPSLVHDTENSAPLLSDGLLRPGESVTLELSTSRGFPRLSLAAMLIPTNDTFMALDSVYLPRRTDTEVYFAKAYDAGTEDNDELCDNIPGPACGGIGFSEESTSDEGFVHISAGIHGEGDLLASEYDWRDAVAKITISRK
ncbi:MAG: spondin domain-containing protein [Paraglaciecola sp.]|uniref:spondin domain-containing protein n=1 Tax=Paraglaciecola sp. TaxID=1920173 RepID=UPI003297428A